MNWTELVLYLMIYSFLGWCAEVLYCAVTRRQFCNRGLLTLPFLPSYGKTFVLLLILLPTLTGRYFLQYLATLIVVSVVDSLAEAVFHWAAPKLRWGTEHTRLFSGSGKGFLISAAIALGYYLVYLIIHPVILGLTAALPGLLVKIAVITLLCLLTLDLLGVLYAMRTGDAESYCRRQENSSQGRLAAKFSSMIWRRLQRAYPGIREMEPVERQSTYTFARGLCLDKLIWVFLISALLGDIIETFWCGLVDGQWMNRSSVLYGPFSFVWGPGAVVLTVTLQGLAEKNDRYVFAAGFVIGGAYEYLCSVFTELVFGTVFWDYSDMPLNIGGRTNVLFCFFWGVLALVWIKVLYPPMSRAIEKCPPLPGKIITWIIMLFMVCNAALTGAAMLRYNVRAVHPEPLGVFDQFLDRQYGDEFMEHRWPNMIVKEN